LEDLLETVLGAEIVDETDTVVDLQKLARKRKKKQTKQEESTD
jgi:CBS domain containing-hemolysin-like protein